MDEQQKRIEVARILRVDGATEGRVQAYLRDCGTAAYDDTDTLSPAAKVRASYRSWLADMGK
jgi:hypothetical protein